LDSIDCFFDLKSENLTITASNIYSERKGLSFRCYDASNKFGIKENAHKMVPRIFSL
jgi:hypothetical protein